MINAVNGYIITINGVIFQGIAATGGVTKYTAVNGDNALRQAIANDLLKRKNTPYSNQQIVVSLSVQSTIS